MKSSRALLSASIAVGLSLCGSLASARVQPGILSRVEYWSDGPCLEAGYHTGMIRNICTDRSIKVILPLRTNPAGMQSSLSVWAWGPSSSADVQCVVASQDSSTGSETWNGFSALVPGGPNTFQMRTSPVELPPNAASYLKCTLRFDGRIYAVVY
jgi:hypothetical protein